MDPVSNACEELFESDEAAGRFKNRFLIAFSGGMDSLVLTHAAARAAERHSALDRVLAVHVDHGLDLESGRWQKRCEDQSRALGIGFESRRLDVAAGANLEARARTARYQVFESLLEEGDVLLLAHHAGDQLESQLLHLFQGRGLYGMPVSRALGAGQIRRPLLGLSRDVLAGYARSQGLEWIEDPSNRDTTLDRNYLRLELLPALSGRFPGLAARIGQVGENLADMSAALDELAGLERQPLPQSVLDGRSLPARIALVRRWLVRHAGAGGASRAAIIEFLRQLDAANDRHPALALSGMKLVRYRRALHLVPPAPALQDSYPLEVPGSLKLPHGELRLQAASADDPQEFAQLVPPVHVTFAAELPGARLRCRGHDRGVRELMRDAGVPPWLRETLPLIVDARGVALIPGVAVRDSSAPAGTDTEAPIAVEALWTTNQAD